MRIFDLAVALTVGGIQGLPQARGRAVEVALLAIDGQLCYNFSPSTSVTADSSDAVGNAA
jgi:hypothetical protein